MALSLPLYNPTVKDVAPPQPGTDFVDSALQGYKLGRVIKGIPQQVDALKIAQLQQDVAAFPTDQAYKMALTQNIVGAEDKSKRLAENEQNLQNQGELYRTLLANAPYLTKEVPKIAGPVPQFGQPQEGYTQIPGSDYYINQAQKLADIASTKNIAMPKPVGYGKHPVTGLLEPVYINPDTKEQEFSDKITFHGMPIKQAPVQGEVDPDALAGALAIYKQTGTIPAFGFGNNPLRTAFFAAIGSEGKDLVNEAQATKAIRSGMSTAYRTQQNLYAATKTAANTLDQQLNLVEKLSNKVGRSGVPVLNNYILYLNKEYAGDEDTAALDNAVRTASNEFARILNGQVASIAGSTVSSADEAHKMLNANLTPSQLKTVVKQMKLEGQFRLDSYKNTIDDLTEELGNVGKQPTGSSQKEEAQKWLNENPNDPRAPAVRKKLETM